MFENFFFVGLPYITLLLFLGGSAYRAFTTMKSRFRGKPDWSVRGDFLWTTRSTGFFGRASIGPATLCLHWGLVILILSHILGFFGGGLNSPSLVEVFRWAGMFGGILLFYGASWAFVRRLTKPQLRAMSTTEDYLVLLFLIVISGLGLYTSAVQLIFGLSYGLGPWLYGLLTFRPDPTLLSGFPLLAKLHLIVNFIFLAWFPFTKLVHMFSYPFGYITRPYISMRSYVALKR
ncbi:MAG: respiratory nitrate reductase subunit gamma [Armatimonadota bacterium]|nr:respiratory nitrate reductase subunit gamma [Armatimonadota bacterium]MDR5702515.1 respiratory nitrate reductase subunit gamma [Armatimonadota bacterium]